MRLGQLHMTISRVKNHYIFWLTIIFMVLIYLTLGNSYHILGHYRNGTGYLQPDERVWGDIIKDWNERGIIAVKEADDNKPLTFLYIQKLLDGDWIKTRLLNALLIIVNTFLIYRLTKRKEAFVYPLFYFFLSSLWLTVEVIETLLLLIMFSVQKWRGWFIGLATIIRPYALLFAIKLTKKELVGLATVLIVFALVLQYHGLLFPYIHRVLEYGSESSYETDYVAILVLIPLMLIARNKELNKWGYISLIPLLFRQFGHYFITPYTLFFLSFLKGDK